MLLFSCLVVSGSLQPHGLQHTRLPCLSPAPRVYQTHVHCQWCHPTISVAPFCSCPQSFPASGCFQWVSSSHQVTKVLEFQLQFQSFQWIFRSDFFRIDWFDFLPVKGTLHSSKASILQCSALFIVQLLHPCMHTGKNMALTRWTFVDKVMSLLLNTLSRFVIASLPRCKSLLISWLQSPWN